MTTPLIIELFGQTYRFESEYDAAQAEAVRDLLIDEIDKVESHHQKQISQISKIAILISAALNIAIENIELKRHETALAKEIIQRSETLMHLIDSAGNSGGEVIAEPERP